MRAVFRLLLPSLLILGSGAALAGPADADGTVLKVKTVPATPGARVSAEGTIATADERGVARLPVQNWSAINQRFHVLETRVSSDRKVLVDRIVGDPSASRAGKPLFVGLRTERLIHFAFVDRGGQPVPTSRISLLELRSNAGQKVSLEGDAIDQPQWLAAGRTQMTTKGLVNKEQYWNITRVVVDGAEAVNSSQQVFYPDRTQTWNISLLFYRVGIVGRDLLFGGLAGTGVELVMPDGELVKVPFDKQGVATFPALPRGTYDVRVYGAGASFTRPLSISRDQEVDIEVITPLDVWLVVATLVLVALSLLVIGRRHRIRAVRLPRLRRASTASLAVLLLALLGVTAGARQPAVADDGASVAASGATGAPAYAYFYIWYQPTSWLRAKSDYPLLGRYSSDDPIVMERQVEMAKRAGLNGFIVSWKHTPTLDRRLAQLAQIAAAQDFELAVVYQGLDFQRHPLPAATVAGDLRWFADVYGGDPVLAARFGKPVVAITGTELFSVPELRRVRSAVGDRLRLLATAKSVEDYQRVAGEVEGDAYYWSSATPGPGWYTNRLVAMGRAVHADDGLWFAPAAPGFDARLIGGEQVIPREDGETLRRSVTAAEASDPDVLSVISWNEYSENSFVEPSEKLGSQTLDVLAGLLGGKSGLPPGTDPGPDTHQRRSGLTGWGALITLLLLFAALNLVVLLLRPSSRSRAPASDQDTPTTERSRITGVRS